MVGNFKVKSDHAGRKPRTEGFRCAARHGQFRCRNYTKHLHGGVQVCYEHWQALRASIQSGLERDGLA